LDGDSGPLYTAVVLDGDPTTGYDVTGSDDDDFFDATGIGDTGDFDEGYDIVSYSWVGRWGVDGIVVSAGEFDNGDPDLADEIVVEMYDGDDFWDTDYWENLEEIRGTDGDDEFNAIRIDTNDGGGGSHDVNYLGLEGDDLFVSHEGADLVVYYQGELRYHDAPTGDENFVDVNFDELTARDTFADHDQFDLSNGGYVRIHGTEFGDFFTSGGSVDGEFRGGAGDDEFFVAGQSNIRFIGGEGDDSFTGSDGEGDRLRIDYENERWEHDDYDGGAWGDDPGERGVIVNLSDSAFLIDDDDPDIPSDATNDLGFIYDGLPIDARTARDTFGDTDEFHEIGEVEIQGTDADDILIGANGDGNNFFSLGGDDLLIGGDTFNYYQPGWGSNIVRGSDDEDAFDMIVFQYDDIPNVYVNAMGSGSGSGHVQYRDASANHLVGEETTFSHIELIVGTAGDDDFDSDGDTDTASGDALQFTGNAGSDHFGTGGGSGNVQVNYEQEKWAHDYNGDHDWGEEDGELGVIVNLHATSNFNSTTVFGMDIDRDGDGPDSAGFYGQNASTATDTFDSTDLLFAIRNVRGTDAVDIMFGSDEDDDLLGEGGIDYLFGAAGEDYLEGGWGDDRLLGGDDDDYFEGGEGDDFLDGGDGSEDTAYYSGSWVDYLISITGGEVTIEDLRDDSPDGTDTVEDVEWFDFNNGIFATNALENEAPTDIQITGLLIVENSANGTVVGNLSATDANSLLRDTATFSIVNPDGRFAIVGASLRVANAALLNFEAATSHVVTVRVTDAKGLSVDESFTVTLTDANDVAPVFSSGGSATVAENTPASTVVYDANAVDNDGSAPNKSITYSLAGADAGRFTINPATGEVRFVASPDFEAPGDAGANNVYDIVVRANDGVNITNLGVAIAVTDVSEGSATGGGDTVTGTGAAEIIMGGLGNDILTGKGGSDTFGFDTKLNKKSNVDHITDFEVGVDKIQLDKSIFKKLKVGELSAKVFTSGKIAKDDRVIYNKNSGDVSYDADGKGGVKAIKFVTLDGSPDNLTAKDFVVVA